jgi:hypothetical protein
MHRLIPLNGGSIVFSAISFVSPSPTPKKKVCFAFALGSRAFASYLIRQRRRRPIPCAIPVEAVRPKENRTPTETLTGGDENKKVNTFMLDMS